MSGEMFCLLGLLDVATLMPTDWPLSCPLTLFCVSDEGCVVFAWLIDVPDALGDAVSRWQGWQGSQDGEKLHDEANRLKLFGSRM
jgi:hypothetical protein